MTETSDAELLAAWVTQRREPAFHALVVRYAGLVHMASKRACGDDSLAADASQLVFIQLAQKAKSLLGHPSLAGWLHVTAVMKTRELLGKNQRESRKRQLFHSAMEPESSTPHDGVWQEIQPHLNDALESLSKNDREAILLRFYRSLSVREIAATLGIANDAAQKRLDRATERLREKLTRRGVTTAGSLSAVMLAGYASEAKAASFSATLLSSNAIAASAVSSTGITSIALLIMTKKTTIAAVALLLLAGGAAVAIKQPTLLSKLASTPQEKRPTPSETASTTSESTSRSGGKKAGISDADAELIAKYGESRTKLARYALNTSLEINELTLSLPEKFPDLVVQQPIKSLRPEQFAATAETFKLNPQQLAELKRLTVEASARRMSEKLKMVAFVRANARTATELLLAGDAVLKGKTSAENYHHLRDTSLPLVEMLHELLSSKFISSGSGQDVTRQDFTFAEEFRKVLDPRQAEILDQKVAADKAERNAAILTASPFDLEQIDQANQESKKVLLPMIESLEAMKQLQGSGGTEK